MANIGVDEQMVAGNEADFGIALHQQSCGTLYKQHPFVMRLGQPFAGWGRLAGRDDALDTGAGTVDERCEMFCVEPGRKITEEIIHRPGGGA